MGFKGHPFTWSNRRFGPQLVEERLDRFLYCKDWGGMFHEVAAEHLETWTSYHNSIMMVLKERGRNLSFKRRTFTREHYEDMWSPYEKCQKIVKHEWIESRSWNCEDHVSQFKRTAKDSLAELKMWSREEFGGREKKLGKLLEVLKNYRQSNNHYEDGNEIKLIERQISDLLVNEEIYWRQRSRAVWLREGDKNTKFFHLKAITRKKEK